MPRSRLTGMATWPGLTPTSTQHPEMSGQLFTQYYLTEGIKSTTRWNSAAANVQTFRDRLGRLFDALQAHSSPNEAVTEQELIRPVLELLGWTDYLPQQGTSRNEDVPDHLLFADEDSKNRAAARRDPDQRYADALVVEESRRFGLPLDARDEHDVVRARTPHGQILRYLSTADYVTDGGARWGILTNGGAWRLYDRRARPRATGYFEVDLAEVLEPGAEDGLRAFNLLFRRDSFIKRAGATDTFLERALEEGRRYEQQVAQDLSRVVFERAFPGLAQALADAGNHDLADVRQAALVLLYRLLFLLYAEDRGLLPVNDTRYDDYGLLKRVRLDVADRTDRGDTFSNVASSYYNHVMTLCRIIDRGDPSIGLPPYNGGLFAAEAAPLLEDVRLPDAAFAPIVHDLSHTETDGERRFVNYRDMSVQQLGSIYERLLEREPVMGDGGEIVIRPNPYARKDSGSFYTPQELVDLIVDRTLKPLVEERLKAFEDKSNELKSDRRPKSQRIAELRRLDPAEAVLDLKVLDPAMGSGHFLVTAVDYLSDDIADLAEFAPFVPEWLDGEYESPLVGRIASIRAEIERRADDSGWILDKAQLTDQAIIRRMVLKRCIYGVDKNPLTVELAKVSLWLHSFTVGAPLSFLDHHLRCGDSLIGLRVTDAREDLDKLGGLLTASAVAGVETAADGMQLIEEMSDADVAEVRESAALFRNVEKATADLRGALDFLCGLRWQTAGMKRLDRMAREGIVSQILGERPDEAYDLLAHGPDSPTPSPSMGEGRGEGVPPTPASSSFNDLWTDATSIARRERFLHWEAAFPGVWRGWQNQRPDGGFDAVIGNPPWDRIKLQEVEWFATRDPTLARAPTAAARRAGIRELRRQGAPLVADFDAARERADKLGKLVRASGHYPLLGGGDINLYSLFVERSMSLIKPDGLVGLLTPSGIYADKTAARFFKSVSTKGRVSGLFDFENRKIFFKDVHASFKFCALVFGGERRRFDRTDCAFFLHDVRTIDDRDRCFPLAPDDFARVNPNTGTAPVFRTRCDADITRRIYERHPVLVDRSDGEERRAWPVRYVRMFDMTNDSHLFRTAARLEEEGFYPVQGNRWRRGNEERLTLYEGKMVQAFDHRAASVVVNSDNLNRPAQPRQTTLEEHADPNWLPDPQFRVSEDAIEWPEGLGGIVAFKHVTAPTNVRTMIACIAPRAGFGNSLPIFLPMDEASDGAALAYKESSHLLIANLNALVFDFVTRQKVQGQNLNWFVVEQLPVIAPGDYDRRFGAVTARELVRNHVLRLTYTAHDMAPFARDLGHDGPPFAWDEEERRHLRARLDALYFHLYGLDRDDARYVLGTFPIVRRSDESQFGTYRTRDLILAYLNALHAGDAETVVAV
ncbi:MAG: restriction endonuclease [Chloroflexi bacterium]|nr:restriction endonuclease [Chloroflexota bacterium]